MMDAALQMSKALEENPNPLYIVHPIMNGDVSDDFRYVYVNQAFAGFLGKSQEQLIGRRFRECFSQPGERHWLDLFADVVANRKHIYVDQASGIINKRMFTEAFCIEPDLCCCIIHDFQNILDDLGHREYRELKEEAKCDQLTGLYNRRYLSELSDQFMKQRNVGVAYLDINGLKATNDAHGHAAGDARILELVDVIRTHYSGCMAFRMGGDEFLVLDFGEEQKDFEARSEACRKALGESGLAAIGYRFYETPEDLDRCVDQCDFAMYREKKRMKQLCQ